MELRDHTECSKAAARCGRKQHGSEQNAEVEQRQRLVELQRLTTEAEGNGWTAPKIGFFDAAAKQGTGRSRWRSSGDAEDAAVGRLGLAIPALPHAIRGMGQG